MNRKLLLATKNSAKIIEMQKMFETLPFELVTLSEYPEISEAEEPYDLLEFNAIAKAKYYGEKTGLLALADDTGLFIDALDGWPGVKSARIGTSDNDRMEKVLEKLIDIPTEKRTAHFRCAIALYDPLTHATHTSCGEESGIIAAQPVENRRAGFGYDPIFFLPHIKKTFAELSIQEKNDTSHRAKALHEMEYILKKEFGARHIVVPCGFVIQNQKIYMQKRNDPFRPDYHGKWEFPGGGVESGEQIKENVVREVQEETGLMVEPVQLLQYIAVEWQEYSTFSYQVYLIPYVCKVVGGALNPRDHEVLEAQWFDLDEVLKYALVGENARMYTELLSELKEVVAKNSL